MFRSIYRPLVWNILFIIYAGFTLTSCPTQPTTPPEPATLSVEYTTCTEVWFRVQIPDSTEQTGVRVYRGDSLLVNFPVAPMDTVIIDTGLQPNTTYSYHTVRVQNDHEQSPSQPLSVTTLPTTSHNFTWTIDTLGNYGSYLNDVAIVDEDNIWVVGNIITDSTEYNAARWDGEQWHLMGIYSNTLDLYSIQYFDKHDIWVLASYPIHWDGNEWTHYHLTNMGIIPGGLRGEIWGVGPGDVYFVGAHGRIVHYDGATFTRIESGTEQTIQDIWGIYQPITKRDYILCAVSHPLGYGERKMLRIISGNSIHVDTLSWPTNRWAHSVWFGQTMELFSCGTGILRFGYDHQWHEIADETITPAFTEKIRGQNNNDIFVVGDYGTIVHYNGLNFKRYTKVPNALYRACAYRNNNMIAVGQRSGMALLLRMYR